MSYKLAFNYPDAMYVGIDQSVHKERFPFMVRGWEYSMYTRINGLPLKAFKLGDDPNGEPCYVFGTLDKSLATYITMNLRGKRAYPWLTKYYNKFYYLARDEILRNLFKQIDVHFLTGTYPQGYTQVYITDYKMYYSSELGYYVRNAARKTPMKIRNSSNTDFAQLELRCYSIRIQLYSDSECTNLIATANEDEETNWARLIFSLAPGQTVYTYSYFHTIREG